MLDARPTATSVLWDPDGLDLFLFSAALWLPHRIHYDLEFARSEGHAGLVVHGPLQVARLLELAALWRDGGETRFVSAEFRHVSPACVGDRLRLTAEAAEARPDERLDAAPTTAVDVRAEAFTDDGIRPTTVGRIVLAGPTAR
jgi:hydroxyacyl-ACP dehydratase HTD2-like protein with hotdog domain